MAKIKIDASRVSDVAKEASCDVRTVLRACEGLPVKRMALERIKAALVALGIVLALLVVGCGTIAIEEPADAGPPPDAMLAPDTTPAGAACRAWGCVVMLLPNGAYGCAARPCIDPPEPIGEIIFPDAGTVPK